MNPKLIKRLIIGVWALFLGTFLGILILVLMVRNDTFGWFGGLPSLEALERPDPNLSSELISADGEILGKYFRQNRTPVSYDELSPELINTLLVTEDIRFKKHSGIDLRGLLRAAVTLGTGGGGSTLTMQLAENLYKTNSENQGGLYRIRKVGRVITKVKEWIISIQLEKSYTKEEILAMYLNTIEFGSNSYGIQVAAKTFFNKLPSELNYAEAAVLVGSLNAPTAYNPIMNPERAMKKRTEVLYNVHKYGLMDRQTFDSLIVTDFGLNYQVDNQNEGLAPYFRTVLGNYLRNWCKEHGYDLYDDGLKIYTTIDSRMQRYAEEAMQEHMSKLQTTFEDHVGKRKPWVNEDGSELKGFLQNAIKRTRAYRNLVDEFGSKSDSVEYYLRQPKSMRVFSWSGDIDTVFSSYDSLAYYKRFLQAGFMAMEPNTGHIKAWVGGINHKYFKYDHVKQGARQPGSTFKPFVYTAAMANGFSPCIEVVDASVCFDLPGQDPPTWCPDNSDGRFSGEVMTLRQAMARSVNSVTAFMMKKVTPTVVVEYARRMGITSHLDAVPSLSLGAGGDVSLFEMVGAYSTFVNKGVHTVPFFITKIEDKNGNIIQVFPTNPTEAINEETAYIMLHMLKGTSEEAGGTALGLSRELRHNHDIGAKTGTTQNGSDGWFMGVTTDLAAGAWSGGDDRSIHFRNWAMGQGARTAMPIWEKFMLKVYRDSTLTYKGGKFERPMKPLSVELDCSLYMNKDSSDSTGTIIRQDDFMIP
jgi:penicillin-binding protein 1A